MLRARRPLVLALLLVLLSACAHQKFDPAVLEPGFRLGDWTEFRFGAFPGDFAEAVAAEQPRVEEWVTVFQRDIDREWPYRVKPEHLPARTVTFSPRSGKPEYHAAATVAGLDAYTVYSLVYFVEIAGGTYVPTLGVSAKTVRVRDGERLWLVSIRETGTPVDKRAVERGALAEQFPRLAERCVKRLMKTLG
jgi:hypothetical protein